MSIKLFSYQIAIFIQQAMVRTVKVFLNATRCKPSQRVNFIYLTALHSQIIVQFSYHFIIKIITLDLRVQLLYNFNAFSYIHIFIFSKIKC